MQILINIIINSALFILISYSFSIIYYSTRFFNMTHATVFTCSAYFAYLFLVQLSFPIYLSVLLGIVCAAIVGILCEVVIYRPLQKRGASSMILMIASLGLYIVLQNVISVAWGDDTKSIRSGDIKAGYEILGAYITKTQIVTVAICLFIIVVCIFFMRHSRIGRNIRAIATNQELSNIIGIDSNKIMLLAFCIGSVLIAISGLLVAFDRDMIPTMGFKWLLYGIVSMIIGGVGSTWGLVGGAFLLATAQHVGAYFIGSQWMDAIAYIILILFLIVRPLGFSGKLLKKTEI